MLRRRRQHGLVVIFKEIEMSIELKVRHLLDDIYQVVEFHLSDDDYCKYDDESVLHQGSIADCEAYVRLKNSDLLA